MMVLNFKDVFKLSCVTAAINVSSVGSPDSKRYLLILSENCSESLPFRSDLGPQNQFCKSKQIYGRYSRVTNV